MSRFATLGAFCAVENIGFHYVWTSAQADGKHNLDKLPLARLAKFVDCFGLSWICSYSAV
jgi:hypothetical protein